MNRLNKTRQLNLDPMVCDSSASLKDGRKRRRAARKVYRPYLECLETRLAPAATASLSQWQNGTGGWVNGDLNAQKAQLFEGDSVAYQDAMTGLTPGTGYTFEIQWETTKAGTHAQDYLTRYDYTWATTGPHGSQAGVSVDSHELDGTTLASGTPFSIAYIPADPNIKSTTASSTTDPNTMINGHSQLGCPPNPPPGTFSSTEYIKMYGATLGTPYGYTTYAMTGDTTQTLFIPFTPSVSNPVMLWGGHIASRIDWGPGNSASFISGSPYHMFQSGMTVTSTGAAVSGVGAQDRSIKVGVVLFPTIIVVNKVATPTSPSQNFNFTNTSNVFFVPGQPTNYVNSFTLTGSNQFLVPPYVLPPAGPTNVTTFETSTFNNTTLTQIAESVPSGWQLTSIAFHSQFGNDGNSTSGVPAMGGSTGTAILDCFGDDTLWVTFSDMFQGTSSTATVIKDSGGGAVTGTLGESVNDTATVTVSPSSGPTPTGTETYTFSGANLANLTVPPSYTKVNATTWTETVTLSGGTVPNSDATPPLPAGSYQFQASYSGDSNYTGSTSPVEPLTINQVPTSTSTVIEVNGTETVVTSVSSGTAVQDDATVTSSNKSFTIGGTVTYYFYKTATPVLGTTTPVFTDTEPVGMDSISTGALGQGSDSFIAVYSGDSNFKGSTGPVEPVTVLTLAQIAPTNTSAQQFASGTAPTLPAIFYSNDGTGHIAQSINPGVFFYYSFATASSGQTITVNEITPPGYNVPFLTHNGQAALYDSTGSTVVASGTVLSNGGATFVAPSTGTFIISIKYSPKTIVGAPTPPSSTVNYNFDTVVSGVIQASAGVPLKLSGTQLAPAAGSGIGAPGLTEEQLQPAVNAAIERWAAAGLSAAQLSVLRNTPIYIASFLDAPRLGVESDGEIWLNATAAGWGWFTNASAMPTAGQMDLLTVVTHEFGHVLFGVQNGTGLMAATLEPGVRLLPSAAELGLNQAPAAVTQSSAARAAGVVPPAVNTVAAAFAIGASQAAGNPVPITVSSNEHLLPTLAGTSQVPAYPVGSADAGRLPGSYVPGLTLGQPRQADALDLLFATGDANVFEDAPESLFAGDHAAPFETGPDLPFVGEDAARLDKASDELFDVRGAVLTDKANIVPCGPSTAAAAAAMMTALAGIWGTQRGDRASKPATVRRRRRQS